MKKVQTYRSFRLSEKIKLDNLKQLPSVKELWVDTWLFLWKHRYKMLGFTLIYTISYLLLVKGIGDLTFDTEGLKDELSDISSDPLVKFLTIVTLYWSLLTSVSVTVDDVSNFIQISMVVVFSLVFIWMIRKLHAKPSQVTLKKAFYNGPRALIPFLGVISVMVLELMPAGLASILYITAQASTVTATETELLGVSVLLFLGIIMSVYLISGSIFAPYIVTLPDIAPFVALRSSMRLLHIHRWVVLRKIFGFYALLLLLGFVITFPFIVWVPRFAEPAFFVISGFGFVVSHTFLYKLYRSML